MMRHCALTLAVLAPAASLEMNSRLLQRAVRRHLGNAAAVAAVATAGPAAFALEFSVAPEPPPPAANSGGFGLLAVDAIDAVDGCMPSMPSMPTPSLPSLPTPSMPSMPSSALVPRGTGRPGQGGRRHRPGPRPAAAAAALRARDVAVFALVSRFAQGGARAAGRGHARRRGAAAGRSLSGANSQGRRRRAGAAPPADDAAAPAESLPFSLPSPSNLPSVAGPGAIWGGLGGNDAAPPKRDDGPALALPSLPKLPSLAAPSLPSLPSFPVAPDAPAAPAEAPGLSLPKLSAPSLPSLPGVPGLPALPALPQVEINPIANIAVERPSVPDDAAPIEYDDLVKKARLGGVTKVEFLSANGDVAVATLSDGSLRSIKVEDDKSGSYKLAAKMRDYGVPYAYSFNLGKFNEAAKRTSMRSKNQNVLDAEARQRDEDARLAALDARARCRQVPSAARRGGAGRESRLLEFLSSFRQVSYVQLHSRHRAGWAEPCRFLIQRQICGKRCRNPSAETAAGQNDRVGAS